MNHVSGDIGQHITHEHGPFITIDKFRIRKSLIVAYTPSPRIGNAKDEPGPGILFILSTGHIGMPCESQEDVDKYIQQLDWIFQKEYGVDK